MRATPGAFAGICDIDGSPGAGPIKFEPERDGMAPACDGAGAFWLLLLLVFEFWFIARCSFWSMAIISFELLLFPLEFAWVFC